MALRGLSRFDAIEYVSNRDPAKTQVKVPIDPKTPGAGERLEEKVGPGATIFMLAPLDVFTMARIFDGGSKLVQSGTDEASIATFVNQTNVEACLFGLKGWKNFLDDKGNDIPFKTTKRNVHGRSYEVADDATMNALDVALVSELGQKIKAASEVTKVEEKNSVGV